SSNTVVPAPNPRVGLRWVEVKPLLESGRIVLVDARAKTAFEAEHIPGAVSLPANAPPEEFVAFAMKYPQTTPIVVYCGGPDCDLSHQLAEKLRGDLGYSDVQEMPGGIVEWRLAEAKSGAVPAR
ncbi:MAG: rhodanese-like domain-containing protein, partial [Verrucomicrobiales bacterium]|nr:rhodanese-like domain-containing protein [Verrucomicrobiales bacterium]